MSERSFLTSISVRLRELRSLLRILRVANTVDLFPGQESMSTTIEDAFASAMKRLPDVYAAETAEVRASPVMKLTWRVGAIDGV